MNIAFVSSEVVPFSKTGGLADVAGALPPALAKLGHSVSVFTPYYRQARKIDPKAKPIAEGGVPVGTNTMPWTLFESTQSSGGAKVYFIGSDTYFDREFLYGTPRGDYEDSCSRFVFFSRACIAAAQTLGKPIDVWHCHDWQTAMIPVYLRTLPNMPPAASVLTIHNLAYQGLFWHWDFPLLNLPWQHFNWKELEFHGKMNLLKGALVHADQLTTVSPTYAQEIQSKEFGCGLEGLLGDRSAELTGIVSGIDPAVWNPETDPLIPARYSAKDLSGKRICKQKLRQRLGLDDDNSLVIGMIGRLFEQKGWDLVAQTIEELLRRDIQLVVLGTGREEYHKLLQRVQQTNPKKVSVSFAFDNNLAHLIQAGSDLFLMPSRYEPSGLNQLYALAYGSPPVVRKIGALADTVVDATPETIVANTASGFQFVDYDARAMLAAIDRAIQTCTRQPETWKAIQLHGMTRDWSWSNSAAQYVGVYEKAIEKAAARCAGEAKKE